MTGTILVLGAGELGMAVLRALAPRAAVGRCGRIGPNCWRGFRVN